MEGLFSVFLRNKHIKVNSVFFADPAGGQTLGPVQEQTQDELREAEPWPALLLPQEHHPQDGGQTLRLPLRV